MYGTAFDGGEVLVNRRNCYQFVLTNGTVDTTQTQWLGPQQQVTQTAPRLIQNSATNQWTTSLSPSQVGQWTLLVKDASGAILHKAQFRAVKTYSQWQSMGLTRSYQGTIWWTPNLLANKTGATNVSQNAGTSQYWLTSGKIVIPYDCGYVFGAALFTNFDLATFTGDDLRFVVYDPVNSRVRGASENLLTRSDITWTAGAWNYVTFDLPVPAQAGDYYGFWYQNNSGGARAPWSSYPANSPLTSSTMVIKTASGALNLTSTVALSNLGGTQGSRYHNWQLLLNPPVVGLWGHSHMGGNFGSTPTTSLIEGTYARSADPGVMLGDMLGGVPCVSMGWDGSGIDNWTGSASASGTPNGHQRGLLQKLNAGSYGYRCSYLVGTTLYNDTNYGWLQESQAGKHKAHYLRSWDALLARTVEHDAELMVVEDFQTRGPLLSATVTGAANWSQQIEDGNRILERWCVRNRRLYIPTNELLGMFSGDLEGAAGLRSEHVSYRWMLKQYATIAADGSHPEQTFWQDEGLNDFRDTGGAHVNTTGRRAWLDAVVGAILSRPYGPPDRSRPVTTYDRITNPLLTEVSAVAAYGLIGANQVFRDCTYDGSSNLTGATIRVYDTAANALTDDGSTGLLATWTVTNTFSSGNLATQTLRRTA